MDYRIAVIKGDGIGPEIVSSAMRVLDKIGEIYNHKFEFQEVMAGGIAIDTTGEPLPAETLDICKKADSVLLGAVGGPKWDNHPANLRPEKALLGIRKALDLYSNIRPVKLYDELINACPIKPEISKNGIDLVVVRELTGGIYFGERGTVDDYAFDTEKYSYDEIKRIGIIGFETAMKRRRKLHSVDKANILASSQLWRKTMHELSKNYPDVEYQDILVDNAAMQLIKNPSQFDVMVTSNMFGDILSDEASMLTGSIGMLPSASLGVNMRGMYEPIHGSAPDIAGKNISNPIATILSASMMLSMSFGLTEEASAIENAVIKALKDGYRSADICEEGGKLLSCTEMTDKILAYL